MAGKFTLQNVLLGIVGTILVAAISFFGASILKGLEKVNDDTTEIKLMKKDLSTVVSDLSDIQANFALMAADRSIEKLNTDVQVLQVRVENLEKKR